ncbi:sugar-phosphatase [Loigolactobacillus iwatensis]|uniref:sugar-phosphatase n=1 Tax=Loigolactobacillus iwatensis TaxID=1267156 RepID=UPI000F7E824C|nr:sugar-phosphatase [Loigolactobacillus iwatensis]
MAIELIAIDIDGTLLNERNELAPATTQAIKAATEKGIKVVLCTGRPMTGVTAYLDTLGINAATDQYVVTFNGALAQTTSGKIISANALSYDDYLDLEALAQKLSIHFHVETSDRMYTANRDMSEYTVHEAKLVSLPLSYRTTGEMRGITISKGMYIDQPKVLDAAIAHQDVWRPFEEQFTFVKSAPFYLEATKKGTNKGSALSMLAQTLNLTADNVMAIGDQQNDLSMIEYAGLGVAMGNAIPSVKQAAQAVTLDNVHDGVAATINQMLN